jgi:hypothetical protein
MRPRNLGSISRRKKKLFSDPKLPEKLWAPKASYSKGVWNYFLGGAKQPGREADNSPPSSAEVKNEWSYTSSAPYAFVACKRITLFFFLLYGT